MEEVPRPGLDFEDRMVHEAKEVLQDWSYELGMVFEECAIPDTDLHILKLCGRMIERTDICIVLASRKGLGPRHPT